MVPFISKIFAKFGFAPTARKNLDEFLLDHERKIFATAHMLGFLLKCTRFPYGKTGKHTRAMNVSENMRPRFAGVL